MMPPTLVTLARAELDAMAAYREAQAHTIDALRRQLDGHPVEGIHQIQARSRAACQGWSEAMDATDAALEAAGRPPTFVTGRPRYQALEALIEEAP